MAEQYAASILPSTHAPTTPVPTTPITTPSLLPSPSTPNASRMNESNYCKNHPNTPSGYFVLEQPWIKYCKNCALNVALCGRKIEQDLNNEQFDRKMQISSSVNELKRTIQSTEQSSGFFGKIIHLLEQAAQPLNDRLEDIDAAIKQLTGTKEKLQRVYESEVAERLTYYIERQSKVALQCREVKVELQKIQSNFGNLILEEDRQFENAVKKWGSLVKMSRKELATEAQFMDRRQKVLEAAEIFYDQIQRLSQFTFSFPFDLNHFKLTAHDETTFDMALTSLGSNSLSASVSLEQTAKKAKGQLKLRSKRRQVTQRDMYTSFNNKRGSLCMNDNRENHTTTRQAK